MKLTRFFIFSFAMLCPFPLLFLSLMGCYDNGGKYYGGGYIMYDYEESPPPAPKECLDPPQLQAPHELDLWCNEGQDGKCCVWIELDVPDHKDYINYCEHHWCFNEYECRWDHFLSICEGEKIIDE